MPCLLNACFLINYKRKDVANIQFLWNPAPIIATIGLICETSETCETQPAVVYFFCYSAELRFVNAGGSVKFLPAM